MFPIKNPKGNDRTPPPGTSWRLPPDAFASLEKDGRLWWGLDGNGELPFRKRFLTEVKAGVVPVTWWDYKFAGSNRNAKIEIRDLFDQEVPFDTPKPSSLVKTILKIAGSPDGIVLDFFAGSGTTAQAVLELNDEDGGDRKFILVQLPEPTGRTDYATISDIAMARIERAADRIKRAHKAGLDLLGTTEGDRGFKVFRLDRSNFRGWDGSAVDIDKLEEQLTLHIDHVAESSSPTEILYELLLKDGFELSTPITSLELAGKQVYSVADGALLICLDLALSQDAVDAMAALNPSRIICLDAGFQGNDQLKANAVQTFRARARSQETAIEFRTV